MPVSLAPAANPTPNMYNQQRLAMPDYFPVASSSSAVMQAQSQPNYDAYAAAPNVGIPPMQHRASSGAWTPQDDQTLLAARAQGLNWAQIQITYFGNKTPNACRKRHERLMERKGADDWDNRKLERLAKEYMTMRKDIWSGLAARTGEKWNVVEAKVCSSCSRAVPSVSVVLMLTICSACPTASRTCRALPAAPRAANVWNPASHYHQGMTMIAESAASG